MKVTVSIEDNLYNQALELADSPMDRSDLFHEALKTFIRVQSSKRLAALGGSMSDMQDIPRHPYQSD